MAILGLFWALVLGQASVAANPGGRDEGGSSRHSVQTAPDGRAHSGSVDGECRLASRWILRWHRHSFAFFKVVRGDDPNDNETSDDPNDDDDAWDYLTSWYDDSDLPIIAWLPVTLPHGNTPGCAPAHWTAPPYLSFPTAQRLRC
jgi:hypothetical protein